MSDLCPLCGGKLREYERNFYAPVPTLGISVPVYGLRSSRCSVCDEVITNAEQSRHNKRLVKDARAKVTRSAS